MVGGPAAYVALMRLLGADSGMAIFVREHLRLQPGERLLDLGCGPGRLAAHLPPNFYLGIDRDEAAIATARRRHPLYRFEPMDLADAAAPGQFDVAVACGVLHHLAPEAASQALGLACASLRPGGRLITLDCALEPGQPWLARRLACADRGRFVRSGADYLALVRDSFAAATMSLRADLLRVPYTHAIVEARKA